MDASPFAPILADLVKKLPGAVAAALVDREGETVDYHGPTTDPYDVKVAAAHACVVIDDIGRTSVFPVLRGLSIRAAARSFVVYALPEGYAIVAILRRRAFCPPGGRALLCAARALSTEARLKFVEPRPSWFEVALRTGARGRPDRVVRGERLEPIEVLGAVVGLAKRETGFRVRTLSGHEMTVVREPGGLWYADEPLDAVGVDG